MDVKVHLCTKTPVNLLYFTLSMSNSVQLMFRCFAKVLSRIRAATPSFQRDIHSSMVFFVWLKMKYICQYTQEK